MNKACVFAAGAVAVWIVAGLMLISRDDLESPDRTVEFKNSREPGP